MGLPCPHPNTRRVSGWEGEEIGTPCPLLLSEAKQAKPQLDAKIKSYGFSFSREEQLAEIPAHGVTCWNT